MMAVRPMCQTTTPMAALPFRLIAVNGGSMLPTFSNGDWLLFRTLHLRDVSHLQPLLGKVVVIERESYPGVHFIKHVKRIDEVGAWVEGDNVDASTDSRQWGALQPTEIVGQVLLRYRRGRASE